MKMSTAFLLRGSKAPCPGEADEELGSGLGGGLVGPSERELLPTGSFRGDVDLGLP